MIDPFERLVGEIKDCAYSPEGWPLALTSLSRIAGAECATILPLTGRSPGILMSPNASELADAYFSGSWHTKDLRSHAIPRMLKTGIAVDQDFISEEAMKREPYYEIFLKSVGFRYFAGLCVRSDDDAWCIALQRRPRQSYFDLEEQLRLKSILKPIEETVRMSSAIASAYSTARLDVGVASLLIDRLGQIREMNAAALALCGSTFEISGRKIVLRDRFRSKSLNDYIHHMLGSDHLSGQRPYLYNTEEDFALFEAHKIAAAYGGGFHSARLILTIRPVIARFNLNVAAVRGIFAITASEAELLQALCFRFSLVKAAQDRGVCHETARQQLKSIFLKTRTSSQGELISLVRGVAQSAPVR